MCVSNCSSVNNVTNCLYGIIIFEGKAGEMWGTFRVAPVGEHSKGGGGHHSPVVLSMPYDHLGHTMSHHHQDILRVVYKEI